MLLTHHGLEAHATVDFKSAMFESCENLVGMDQLAIFRLFDSGSNFGKNGLPLS